MVAHHLAGAGAVAVDVHGSRHEPVSADLRQRAMEIAHDLRGPLMVAAGNAELLVRMVGCRLTEEEQRTMATLLGSIARMDSLIQQLLLAPAEDRSYGSVDLDVVVGDVLACHADILERLDAELHVGELGSVTGDGVQLYRLFQNLIGNAIRYRSRARRLVLGVRGEDDGHGRAFTVNDNGVGFDSVNDAGRGADRFGVGLRICGQIADQHGGSISIASTVEGAAVRVWLPLSGP